jgi:hypothetical protein
VQNGNKILKKLRIAYDYEKDEGGRMKDEILNAWFVE